jgi:phenylacetate-CoA ligase
LFSPVTVEEVVRSFDELQGEFEIHVEKRGDLDYIGLKIEMPPGIGEDQQKELLTNLASALRWKTQLNLDIQPVEFETLPRYQVKAKRFHDKRGEK